jgi:hypothetical protein
MLETKRCAIRFSLSFSAQLLPSHMARAIRALKSVHLHKDFKSIIYVNTRSNRRKKVFMRNQAKQPLRLRLRLKVRQQLMLIFSGLLLALVLVSFVTTFSLFEDSENTLWAGRQRDAARSVAAQVRNVIDQAQGVLQAVAELSQFAFIANPLQPILQTNPSLEEIAVISTSGRVIALSASWRRRWAWRS